MARNAIARLGGSRRNFRQCDNDLSFLCRGRFIHARQLAWIARRIASSIVEALSFLGSSDLFDFAAERAGVASQADCVLAITRVEWFGARRRALANLGHGRCNCIRFRISPRSLYPGI